MHKYLIAFAGMLPILLIIGLMVSTRNDQAQAYTVPTPPPTHVCPINGLNYQFPLTTPCPVLPTTIPTHVCTIFGNSYTVPTTVACPVIPTHTCVVNDSPYLFPLNTPCPVLPTPVPGL